MVQSLLVKSANSITYGKNPLTDNQTDFFVNVHVCTCLQINKRVLDIAMLTLLKQPRSFACKNFVQI